MKKTLLLGLLLAAGLNANAQLASGSMAPDFTATDIDGNTHTLSTYLAAGKTVILDISATWCAPCWNFHNGHALTDLYNAYGPGGSNEIVVLFVEGDGATTLADLHGTGTNTRGDWTADSPYPIIDNASIGDASHFDIEYFPSLFRICPTGISTLINTGTAVNLRNGINSGCQTLVGVANHARILGVDQKLCDAPDMIDIQAKMKNYGNNVISSAVVVLKANGTVVATQNYTGNVGAFGNATINFTNVPYNAGADYKVEITQINASTPFASTLLVKDVVINTPAVSNNNIEVRVYTDNYPGEISWNLKNSAGTIVASGGPYTPGDEDEYHGGGPDANTMITQAVSLPEGIDCYAIEVMDSFNDGWSLGATAHGIEIISAGAPVFQLPVGNFGSALTESNAFKTNNQLGTAAFDTAKFAIYPNPSTGVFNFTTQETVTVTILDITGKVVYTAKNIENGASINLGSLQKGIYVAKINGAKSERIEKIIVQ